MNWTKPIEWNGSTRYRYVKQTRGLEAGYDVYIEEHLIGRVLKTYNRVFGGDCWSVRVHTGTSFEETFFYTRREAAHRLHLLQVIA